MAFVANAVIADKYVLVRRLGAGGMGVVWVAYNQVLDVHVALKLIDIEQSPNPKRTAARLLQEARAAARIAHPAICRVFEFGSTQAGDPFIVSELLHGETLGDLMAREPRLDALRAVALLLPIVDGVASANGKGIVHRDIKPDNIFLSRDDGSRIQPKLLDFGIARVVDADHKLTIDGTLLGTPDYMSPEQARGASDLDVRTDVWSLSVVLYELITGSRPFLGDNYNALLWAISHETPVPAMDLGAGDAALWSILARGLAKDRNARWDSAHALGVALAAWLVERGVAEDICGGSLRKSWLDAASAGAAPEVRPNSESRATPLVAPLHDDGRGGASGEARPATGVFSTPNPPPVAGPRWTLALLAAGVALVAGFSTVLFVSSPGAPTTASQVAAPLSPLAAAGPPTAAPTSLGRIGPSAPPSAVITGSASAAPSASSSASVAPYRARGRRKPNPDTYDFGF